MLGAFPFGGGYFGDGPALTPAVVVYAPVHLAHLAARLESAEPTGKTARASGFIQRLPSTRNLEQL